MTAQAEHPIGRQIMGVNGPMARRVKDVRLALEVMSQGDAKDPWWVPAPLKGAPMNGPIRVAVTVDPSGQGVHPDVAAAIRSAAKALADAGYIVEEVEPPSVANAAECFLAILATELRHASMPVLRKLGNENTNRSLDLFLSQMPDLELFDYMKLLSGRNQLLREWQVFLERYPIVLGPVSTEPPFEVDFDLDGPRGKETMRALRMLFAVPLLGLPAVSVPVGTTDGVPLGVQVIASRFREDLCLDAAEVIEAKHSSPTPIDPVRQASE
jgi:amidase